MSLLTPPPDALLSISRAHRPLPLADGSLVFASDLGGHPQVYRVRAPGEWPQRLTNSSDRTLPVAETSEGILVRHDHAGNETWQLSIVDPRGGLRQLTTDARAIHRSPVLHPDRGRVGIAYNPGGQVDFRLGVLDLESGTIEDWLTPAGLWRWAGWSPDGSAALVSNDISPTRVESYILRKDQQLVRLLPGARRLIDPAWTARGSIVGVSDLDSEFLGVVEIDPDRPGTVSSRLLQLPRDVEAVVLNPEGTLAVAALNEGACDRLLLLDLQAGTERPLDRLGRGLVYSDNTSGVGEEVAWTPDGASAFAAWESPIQPADIFQLRDGARWTFASGERREELREPENVAYESFDGLEIPALLYKADGRAQAAVVYFHGGPEGQSRASFQPLFQMLVGAGVHVLAPNVRGSTGYGFRYCSLDDRELRWNSVRDGCGAARFLKASGLASRVAAVGASYGGFMTLAVLVEDPGLWDAGVDIVGIADWHSFFKNTSGWRRASRIAEYGDPEGAEAELLREISPLGLAHRIAAPLLVIHGRNDIRVPVSEAEQVAAAVQGSELMILEDEGHGIVKHANRRRAYGRAMEFLAQRLGVGSSC